MEFDNINGQDGNNKIYHNMFNSTAPDSSQDVINSVGMEWMRLGSILKLTRILQVLTVKLYTKIDTTIQIQVVILLIMLVNTVIALLYFTQLRPELGNT